MLPIGTKGMQHVVTLPTPLLILSPETSKPAP